MVSFDPTPDLGPVQETKATPAPAFGVGNSTTRPAQVEEADTRLPSERLFSASQSERMRAAADRHFASVEGGAL